MPTFKFTREFNHGHLAGITHDDKISFPNAGAFQDWVDWVNSKTALDYSIVWAEGDEFSGCTQVEVY